MQLNDDITSLPSMPAMAATVSPGYFQNNPSGTPTRVRADFLNGISAELLAILAAASIAPNKASTNQILTAIQTLIANAIGTPTVYAGQTESTGSANAQVVAATTPAGFTLTIGFSVTFVPGFNNSGSTTLNVDSTGVETIQKASGGSLVNLAGGELVVGDPVTVVWNGSVFVLQTGALGQAAFKGVTNNALSSAAMVSGAFTAGDALIAADANGSVADGGKRGILWSGTSGGAANVQTLTPSPFAPAAYVTGDAYCFIAGFTNTGSMTLNINALGAKNVASSKGGTSLPPGFIKAGKLITVRYDGANLVVTDGGGSYNGTPSAGYETLNDGSIRQWGTQALGNNVAVTFSFAFPNAVDGIKLAEAGAGTWPAGGLSGHAYNNLTGSGFTHFGLEWNGTAFVSASLTCYWEARGI